MGRKKSINALKSLVERFEVKGLILKQMISWNYIKMGINEVMCLKKRRITLV